MSIIKILDDNTINKIAAGEVIEKPASIVKELVENSIDAGANDVTIEVSGGGISSIRIIDNGKGIAEDDLESAFLRHATSKIESELDLETISSLGFRGEALASIAAVSKIELISRIKDSQIGNKIVIEGGRLLSKEECGCPEGTIITIKDVFFNTPARLKFLKTESREGMYITDVIEGIALSNTKISIKYRLNNKNVLSTRGDGELKNVLLAVYGKDIVNNVIRLDYLKDFISIKGYIGNSNIAKNSRNNQSVFINGRIIKNKTITAAVEAAFKSMLTINKFPFFIVNITVNPEFVDVNVHPSKAEVKFQDDQIIFKAVYAAVKDSLLSVTDISNDSTSSSKPTFIANVPPIEYKQEKIDLNEAAQTIREDNSRLVNTIVEKIEPTHKYKTDSFINDKISIQNSITEKQENNGLKENTEILNNHNSSLKGNNNNPSKYVPKTHDDKSEVEQANTVAPVIITPKFEPLAVVGQLHLMYIIAEGIEDMYLIDQHAAHERIYYEKYVAAFNNTSIQSQSLLVPVVAELSLSEKQCVLENEIVFSKLGYEIDDFGGNAVQIRSIPVIYGNPNTKELFYEIIQSIDLKTRDIYGAIDSILYKMSCKSAIKAGDKLSYKEMVELIDKLRKCENPFNCPHGRPTIIKMSYYDLEKKFKRIQ